MSHFQLIQNTLERTARRRRLDRAWRGFWHGLLWGCLVWFVIVALFKIFPLPVWTLSAGGYLIGILMLVGFLAGWWRKASLTETARWVDSRQHLQERLSTALEISSAPVSENWRKLLVSDAANHVQKLDLRKLLPYHLPKACRWALLVLALGVGLGFVPEYRSKQYLQRQKEAEIMRDTGKQMAELVRRNIEKRPPAMEPTRNTMESVAELGDLLSKAKLTRTDALKDLASVAEKLQQQGKELARNPALKRLEQAARTPGGNSETSSAALQKKIEDLQKALGKQNADSDALDKLKKELQKAKEAASGLAHQDSSKADAVREQLMKSLESLSQQAKDLGASLPDLEAAIEALKDQQTDTFLKDLDLALNDLEKMKELAKALQQLQKQQADQLGKDLAEQLKNGQAEAAQETLEKMVEKLRSASLTPEQLKKMLEEVSKAVDPATPYGKVGELLKQAAQQMQQGQKPNAAQSLADAAKELEKLLEQMGDAQSLAATLDALKRAQMSVANCKGWGQSKSRYPRAGRGGKPGVGVGTWADENAGWFDFPEQNEMVDNSNVQRPDTDARGHTDRGEGELADNLAPTKVKGQFTPGGQMPSISLKGVSIKGTSSVGYQEAVVAAQSDAQSALNQDQVPRAYQGAVRDYFDDLKK